MEVIYFSVEGSGRVSLWTGFPFWEWWRCSVRTAIKEIAMDQQCSKRAVNGVLGTWLFVTQTGDLWVISEDLIYLASVEDWIGQMLEIDGFWAT